MSISPFDKAREINEKSYNFDEEEKGYNSFMVNRILSYFPDTIYLVNEANRIGISGKRHYDFLYHSIPKKKRYSKWIKEEKPENVDVVMEIYNLSYLKAKEYLRLLSESEIKILTKQLDKGGMEK